MKRNLPFNERYKINPDNGCWEFLGTTSAGYGNLSWNGIRTTASRISYIIHVGDIPKGMIICHRCDNPICVNPEHLFCGSQSDNLRDAREKGRRPSSKHPSLTTYLNGCRCLECKKVVNEIQRKKHGRTKPYSPYRNKITKPAKVPIHPSFRSYLLGCKCEECRKINAENVKRYRQKQKIKLNPPPTIGD